MAVLRVPVANTVGKSVRIDSNANQGATIGEDLRLPDGTVPSLTELAAALATEAVAAEQTRSFQQLVDSIAPGQVPEGAVTQHALAVAAAISVGDLSDVNTTGHSDNDLMFWSGGVLVDTAGLLTWDGNILKLFDATGTSAIAFAHNGSNLQVTGGAGTSQIFLNELSLTISDGKTFVMTDTTGSDGRLEDHDGTDFNTLFVQTDNWNIAGTNINAPTVDAIFDVVTGSKFIAAAGTEADPSWHFAGDPDTGAFSPGANIYAITVGGTEAVRYTGSSVPLIQYGMATGITASTTQTQGEGALHASYVEVSVCANNNDTVTLPPATPGCIFVLINNGAKRLQVFPASGDDLGLGIDQPDTIKAGASVFYLSYNVTNWFDIATKFAGLLDTDIVGISANDLLYYDGTNYTGTGGLLTWDASLFDITGDLQISGDVGFYGTAAVAQQTGVAVSAAGIHAALVNLGLITA